MDPTNRPSAPDARSRAGAAAAVRRLTTGNRLLSALGRPRRPRRPRRHHSLDWVHGGHSRSTQRPATTTTTAPAGSTPADTWVLKAVAAEQHVGSVQVAGKITQGKSQIFLQLLVNGDGEGGGEFVQQGSLIKIERVGPLLYFNAPAKFWATHAGTAQTKTYGGKWIELSAVDPRFTSFDQFLDAADLVVAAFQGHTTPLTVSRPTTFAGHKVVVVKDTVTSKGKTSTGLMYIAAKGPALVYKIVDDTPGNASTVVFDHYGKGATLTVPPNAINLS